MQNSINRLLAQSLGTVVCLIFTLALPNLAHAHGFAGDYFFPATLTTEDPFVADELSLPTFSTIVEPGEGGGAPARRIELSAELSKRITKDWQISIETGYVFQRAAGESFVSGFDNLVIGTKYQFLKNAEHQLIGSVGFEWQIGGSGSKKISASSFSTVSPSLFLGKGFGDLPDCVWFLRPLAVTGAFDLAIPLRASNKSISFDVVSGASEIEVENNPDVFEWGFAVEYSLIYLQEHVKDLGIRGPLSRLIPLVEFSFQNPLDRGRAGLITGTINPGIIWSRKYFQVGVEAIIPINERTGKNVGVIAQIHFYLDDILPSIFTIF
jgi:hypothetical protein